MLSKEETVAVAAGHLLGSTRSIHNKHKLSSKNYERCGLVGEVSFRKFNLPSFINPRALGEVVVINLRWHIGLANVLAEACDVVDIAPPCIDNRCRMVREV